jgi:hypothetical protein
MTKSDFENPYGHRFSVWAKQASERSWQMLCGFNTGGDAWRKSIRRHDLIWGRYADVKFIEHKPTK